MVGIVLRSNVLWIRQPLSLRLDLDPGVILGAGDVEVTIVIVRRPT